MRIKVFVHVLVLIAFAVHVWKYLSESVIHIWSVKFIRGPKETERAQIDLNWSFLYRVLLLVKLLASAHI